MYGVEGLFVYMVCGFIYYVVDQFFVFIKVWGFGEVFFYGFLLVFCIECVVGKYWKVYLIMVYDVYVDE